MVLCDIIIHWRRRAIIRNLNLKLADYIIIGALFFAGLAGLWANLQKDGVPEPKYALIYVNNKLVAELSLGESERFQHRFSFGEALQHQAVVEVEGGKARLLEMSAELCPQGICSHTGWISRPYESIVCLPNRIMVVFRENTHDNGLDGVTY